MFVLDVEVFVVDVPVSELLEELVDVFEELVDVFVLLDNELLVDVFVEDVSFVKNLSVARKKVEKRLATNSLSKPHF